MSADLPPDIGEPEREATLPLFLAWLLTAGAAVLVSAAALLAGDGAASHLVGYVTASLVAFSGVALFRRRARQRFRLTGYVAPRVVDVASVLILLSGFAMTIAHAWFIARRYA